MTEAELSEFMELNYRRDMYLDEVVQTYTDAGMFQDAFDILELYPCPAASLKKLDLKITLRDFELIENLIYEVSEAFGYGGGDNIYYDDEFSNQVPVFYPLLIDLIQNGYSESILSDLNGDLSSLAGEGGYLGGAANNILCAETDGSWTEIIPRGEYWVPACNADITTRTVPSEMVASIGEIKNGRMTVYPNPASTTLNILDLNTDAPVSYRVISVTGKEQMQGKFAQGAQNVKLNISDLSPGIYILEIKGQNTSRSLKFSKQ
jgi:hypothetical protein